MNEGMNEWINEGNEWMNECMNEWMNEWKEWMNDWMNGMNEMKWNEMKWNELIESNEWMNE